MDTVVDISVLGIIKGGRESNRIHVQTDITINSQPIQHVEVTQQL